MAMVQQEEEKAGVAEWVVTFGDMMSLLLTFFIMLASLSELKEEQRYQAMVDSIQRRFGYEATTLSLLPGELRPRNSALAKLATLGRARRLGTMSGGDKVRAPVGEYPRVQEITRGEQATSGGVILFDEGSAELTKKNQWTLRDVAEVIGGKPQKIEIRGHTSTRPLPPEGAYKTHWDLAYERCRKVKDYLVKLGIDPKRIRLAVAADNEPKHVGDDPLLRKENSRVEILMLNELVKDLEGTVEEQQRRLSGDSRPLKPLP